jgi:thiamine kinase-like enzyme
MIFSLWSDKVNKRVSNKRVDRMANERFSIISTWDEKAKTFCHFDMKKHWLVGIVKWQDDSQ